MKTNLEFTQTIPMSSVDSVLLGWQVVEITCIRRTLDHAINRNLGGFDGSWEKAFAATDPVLSEIRRKCRLYRLSVNRMLTERGMAGAEHLEEAIAAANTRSTGDQLVCHVAMSLTYAWLVAMIDREQSCASGRDDALDRICSAVQDHALALYALQKEDWARTARQCHASGIDVSGLHPVPDPFGVNGEPCWRLMPVAIGVGG